MSACAIDGSPTGDGSLLCAAHRNRLEQRIAEMPALARELELTLTRQSSTGERHGGRSADKPLPYDVGASEALSGIRAFLVGWTRDLGDHRGGWPANDENFTLAAWLVKHIDALAMHMAADEIAKEAKQVDEAAERVIFGSLYRARVKVGPCPLDVDGKPCEGHILALIPNDPQTSAVMVCVACKGSWSPEHWLLAGRMILGERARRDRCSEDRLFVRRADDTGDSQVDPRLRHLHVPTLPDEHPHLAS